MQLQAKYTLSSALAVCFLNTVLSFFHENFASKIFNLTFEKSSHHWCTYWETQYKKRHSRLLTELPILIMLKRRSYALYVRHVLKIYVYKNIGHTTALLSRVDVLFPNIL